MARLSKRRLNELAQCIVDEIKDEFSAKHLSKNLVNTIRVESYGNRQVSIIIPAETYNFYQYFAHKVVVHNGKGSYASKLNDEGSEFMVYWKGGRKVVKPHNHIGFVDRAVDRGTDKFIQSLNGVYELKSKRKDN